MNKYTLISYFSYSTEGIVILKKIASLNAVIMLNNRKRLFTKEANIIKITSYMYSSKLNFNE